MLGQWKNFDEMEENLNLEEMKAILDASRKQEHQRQKFAAALKGVNLDESPEEDVPTFEDVKRRAEAKARGLSEDAVEFGEVGFAVIEG